MSHGFAQSAEKNFLNIGQALLHDLKNDEHLFLNISGEESLFVRFNNGKIRQTGIVQDGVLNLKYLHNNRVLSSSVPFTGNAVQDTHLAHQELRRMREESQKLPEDPFPVLPEAGESSHAAHEGHLLPPGEVVEQICSAIQGLDFTGYYCGGPIFRGAMNSKGQKHWFATESFFLDYSLWHKSGKAVKECYAGTRWNRDEFVAQIASARPKLAVLDRPLHQVSRGAHRVFLGPGAMEELCGMFAWGALSEKAIREGESCFMHLRNNTRSFSSLFHLKENFRMGLTPRFNDFGHVAPETLPLVEGGALKNTLVSARTAQEYQLPHNGASDWESPRALEVGTGRLSMAKAAEALGTGLYLSNLHYLNWSDRAHGRITGLTRYACFYVENGEFVAPIQDMRFDDVLFDIFGSKLLELTQESWVMPSTSTYEQRSLGGVRVPGALVDGFTFSF